MNLIRKDAKENLKNFLHENGISEENFVLAIKRLIGKKVERIDCFVNDIIHVNLSQRADNGMRVGEIVRFDEVLEAIEVADILKENVKGV